MNKADTSIQELLDIMTRLRDPVQGCPWDKSQTFESIIPHTLEETYEVIDAIERAEPQDIKVELGDLLLQILFYCQIGKEKSWFDFHDVVSALEEKLIRRHPHIFSGEKMHNTAEEQHNLWEALKEKERQKKQQSTPGVLADIPKNLPALVRAQKLQARAARVGFDWPHIRFVLDKIQEEIKEFEESYTQNDKMALEEELGDILFVCANLARHIKSDAETILRRANDKFERRFSGVESRVNQSGQSWEAFTLEALDQFWDEVKIEEKR